MEMDEVLPALSSKFFCLPCPSFRGTDPSSTGDNDFMFSTPAAPTPSHHKPTASSSAGLTSPVMSSMAMQPMSASIMFADNMLRAYAERKAMAANKSFEGGISMAQISYSFQRPIQGPVAGVGG